MSILTEQEIFECLTHNLILAANDCDILAVSPSKGVVYDRFRKELELVEGACRQAAAWRADARWLVLGMQMAQCHSRAGNWLRGAVGSDGVRRKFPDGVRQPLFSRLAEILREALVNVDRTKTARTGILGPILPKPPASYTLPAPHGPAPVAPQGGLLH